MKVTHPQRRLVFVFLLWLGVGLAGIAAQEPAVQEAPVIAALEPTPRNDDWWQQRHQQKLEAKQKMERVDLLMIGDSITESWEGPGKSVWDEFYANRNALNIGFSGDRTEHVLWRLQNREIDEIAPKVAVVMIGTNNTGHRMDPAEETAEGIKKILDELKTRLPETRILLISVFPRAEQPDAAPRVRNNEINQLIREYADGERIVYLDVVDRFLDDEGVLPKAIMPDFLHPQEQGYRIWAEAMEPQLAAWLGSEQE